MNRVDLSEHNDLCVGIDLGTTNSVLAIINEKNNGDIVSKVVNISRAVDTYAVSSEPKLSTEKKATLPSYVYYRQEKNYEPLVGDFAKRQYPLRPHLVAKSIKSQMGKLNAIGLSEEIPDKTPAEISSRILKHLLKEASKVYRCPIDDAVITVPANFDSSMCKATRDAAELAGIKVRNSDGTERPILLSEPNAVIYDLINQIHNGEIPDRILDLSKEKKVLVFDLGGGTLDITMHKIKRRDENSDVLKVDEIATNRYTLLGGDDFDEEIAKSMYKRYLNQFINHKDILQKLSKEESIVMAPLRVYAENLKLELSESCGDVYESGWDDDVEEFSTGGTMGGIGYSYDDTFTQQEIEDILSVFMAKELSYNDYKIIDKISNTRNIIYPILDVLKKASDKLNVEDVSVDAVIVNGGMSKFYMVTDRLKEFFGFEPIVALDPDQAVARGAAVYHYYLHKYAELQDDMKMLGDNEQPLPDTTTPDKKKTVDTLAINIEWGNTILNDSLYLGMKNGAVHQIIPTGEELPYMSKVQDGFRIEPGQNRIAIPIKSRNLDGTYRTIATGNISFKQKYGDGAFVAFQVHMAINKVIKMRAWTSYDQSGLNKIEEGYVEIAIDNGEKSNTKTKFVAPSGSNLNPKSEINNMLQLCQNFEKCKNKQEKTNISKRISSIVSGICNSGNKKDFADCILNALSEISSEETRQRLFVIARKLAPYWNDTQKIRLANTCMSQINTELCGFSISGPKVSANIQAVYTLSVCASIEQLNKLYKLHSNTKYLQACLYTHARTHTDLQWLQEEFEKDAKSAKLGRGNNLQFSSNAIGISLRKEGESVLSAKVEGKIVKNLIELIESKKISNEELTCCILAIANICDQRIKSVEIESEILYKALQCIREVEYNYDYIIAIKQEKAISIAEKMINGDILNKDEEEFLLTKLEQ